MNIFWEVQNFKRKKDIRREITSAGENDEKSEQKYIIAVKAGEAKQEENGVGTN